MWKARWTFFWSQMFILGWREWSMTLLTIKEKRDCRWEKKTIPSEYAWGNFQDRHRPFFYHFTTAVDTESIRRVFEDVRESLLENNLKTLMMQWLALCLEILVHLTVNSHCAILMVSRDCTCCLPKGPLERSTSKYLLRILTPYKKLHPKLAPQSNILSIWHIGWTKKDKRR